MSLFNGHETLEPEVSSIHNDHETLGNMKMWFFKGYEIKAILLSLSIQYFGGVKKRFLKRPETHGSTLRGNL
jgi:hypothetical protein